MMIDLNLFKGKELNAVSLSLSLSRRELEERERDRESPFPQLSSSRKNNELSDGRS